MSILVDQSFKMKVQADLLYLGHFLDEKEHKLSLHDQAHVRVDTLHTVLNDFRGIDSSFVLSMLH